jgi:hypothetical protein
MAGSQPFGNGPVGGGGPLGPASVFGSTSSDLEYINNEDRQPSLFIGDREVTFFQRVATELMECVTQQKIRYYAIEGNLSETDEFYGESSEKVFRQPIEVYALILYNAPEVKTGTFSTETTYSMKLYIQKFRVEQDLKMTPRMGDYIEFGQKFYEITKVYEPQLIAGLDTPGFKMGVYVEAISARAEVFGPNRRDEHDPSINSDSFR